MAREAPTTRGQAGCSSISIWLAVLVFCATVRASTSPTPIAVPVGTQWYGDDGSWSPVTIRVGSPPQWVYVLPSTASQETWVVGPGGCDGTFTCQQKRGGLFFRNESSTWDDIGYYELGLDTQLGFSGSGDYGFDQIELNDQIVLESQIVGIVNTTDHWLGYLGLGVEPTNFTEANKLTFLSSLVENKSYIPSHSYGYTAGAYYRLKNVPASLTFGGVDANRFVQNDVSFSLAPNQQPVVAVNSITVSAVPLSTSNSTPSWNANPLTLLGSANADLFTIDSSTPYLWLPETVCDAFAKALGLQYNDTIQLYTFGTNTTAHDTLVNWNLTFTFTVADLPSSPTRSIDLTLPYDAFDLQLTYPFPGLNASYGDQGTNYFPLRKAPNNTQYTIGRSFLQETYLIVDYERNNFSVSQAKFALDALTDTNIVEITRPLNSTFTGPVRSGSSSGLSSGAKAGIGIGVVAIVLATIAAITYFCLRRRHRGGNYKAASTSDKAPTSPTRNRFLRKVFGGPKEVSPTELSADKRYPAEISADSQNTRFEMEGSAPVELAGSAVGVSYYVADARKDGHGVSAYEAANNKLNPQTRPAELEHHNSMSKDGVFNGQPSPQTLPAYSPSNVGQRESHNLSQPTSATTGISPQGISPQGNSPHNVSRSSSQLTSPLFSPLSPPRQNSHPGHGASPAAVPYVTGGGRLSSNSLLNTPRSQEPTRSASRSSRFREEGISNEPDPPNVQIVRRLGSTSPLPARRSTPNPEDPNRRFSWEE